MPKRGMTGLDVSAVVAEMRGCLGMRVANIYDINNKVYLFKLAAPDMPKIFILIESGVRLHTTGFMREKGDTPNNFCVKLRKHIRTKRLEDVRQLGVDRVVDFTFGTGEAETHVIVEVYGMGNVILTDASYTIMNVLRQHAPEKEHVRSVGDVYDMHSNVRTHDPMTTELLTSLVDNATDGTSLKQLLQSNTVYGNAVLTHCLAPSQFKMNSKVSALLKELPVADLVGQLLPFLQEADSLVVATSGMVSKGFVTLKESKHSVPGEEPVMLYDEFLPYLYSQFADCPHECFGSFGSAVDTFFAKIETQKIDSQKATQQADAVAKVDKVRAAQSKQLNALQSQASLNERKATLIEMNHELVDNCIAVVTTYLAQGMSWDSLGELIQQEAVNGNPLAQTITKVNFSANEIVLQLEDTYEDSDEEDQEGELVEIDIGIGAFANARGRYVNRKGAVAKKEKTLQATEKGIKAAEAKAQAVLKKEKITAHVTSIRKVYWFEKFLWFVSSDGYLVIAGHDAQQNEMVVKRHLEKHDVYVHGDLHGAASCVVKNPNGSPIPPSTMEQAGQMAICRSNAWSSRVVTSAWWVYPEQVSKTAPSGEYLVTGSFIIRGKKNYLPPSRLELGFGLLFSLDDASLANHVGEWKVHAVEGAEAEDRVPVVQMAPEAVESSVESCVGETEQLQRLAIDDELAGDPEVAVGAAEAVDAAEAVEAAEAEEADETEEAAEAVEAAEAEDAAVDVKSKYGDAVNAGVNPSERHQVMQEIVEQEAPKPKREGSKRMSKKERELRKKGMNEEEIEEYMANAAVREASRPSVKEQLAAKEVASAAKPVEVVRGKSGKKKKLKDKYADQDEDERAIRMELLGHKPASRPKPSKAAAAAAAEEAANTDETAAASVEAAAAEEWCGLEEEREGWIEEDGKWRRMTPAEKRVVRDKESLEIRQLLEEEGITTLSKDDADKLAADQIRTLTAVPTAEDKLMFAMAICGPYSALAKYKYKVKVTPGTQKRGRATKQAFQLFQAQNDCVTAEREIIKTVPDQEAIAVMVSDSKISAPGIEKAKRNAKQNAKKQRQQKK